MVEIVLYRNWEIEDVLDRKGRVAEEKVLVKWADWEAPPTSVDLRYNVELHSFLTKNRAYPHTCTLIKNELRVRTEMAFDMFKHRFVCNQTSLSDVRYTPKGSVGRQRRVSVKVHFRKDEFDRLFGRVLKQKSGAPGNGLCHATLEELHQVFEGEKWASRQYPTSTETFILPREFIHVTWGYKGRL